VQSFRNLRVWEKSHLLTLNVYASSCCRKGDAEMARFLQMAMGSASELEYQLLLARDLNYRRDPGYENLTTRVIEVKKMLSSLMQKVKGLTDN
jgi:four helix bundle protein